MKIPAITGIIGALILVSALMSSGTKEPTNHRCVFYGDKGEEIPFHAAQILVKAEFYRLTLSEIDTLQKYFILTRHICPYKNCPMLDQVRFNGCGLCETNSTCYALDMIHWEYPLWTYEECTEYLKRPL